MSASGCDTLVRFGQTVRTKRNALKLTQEALAERSSLHRTYIADIERGTRNVSLLNVAKLAHGLSCHMADLLSDTDKGLE